MKGKVRWYNRVKGFGFIVPEAEDTRDVFVHYSGIVAPNKKERILNENDPVEFLLEEGPKGPIAREVRKVAA